MNATLNRRSGNRMRHGVKIIGLILLGAMLMIWPFAAAKADDNATLYDFSFDPLMGDQKLDLAAFRGKVVLMVNTASKCGFTPQYDGLEKLYQRYKDQGLVIVGVPSDDFGGQEPADNEGIASFCKLNFGVTFPMATKTIVTGDEAHPFYKYVRDQAGALGAPKWNFYKYLFDRQGHYVDYFSSITKPEDDKLTSAIEAELAKPAR